MLTDVESPSAAAICRQLDELLFAPAGWFCIDTSNRRVPGATPGTLDQALALIGHAAVATVVGQLRPEALGVDIDAGGALGTEAATAIAAWCAARGLWHLQRASGGGEGRWHLFVAPGVHAEDLVDHVAAVRRELRLTARQLDARRQLRPLSAPHRRTGATTHPAELAAAAVALQEVLQPPSDRVTARRRATPPPSRPATAPSGPEGPLTPLRRQRRELPPIWAAYLARGRQAAAAVDRDPGSRSQLELEATCQLVLAGYSEPEAWAAIASAHSTAFTKARSRGRRWWWHTWNRCVHDCDTWLRAHRVDSPPSDPLPATERARAELAAHWLSWPTRTRHTDVEIYTVVLARMDRTGAAATAIPQRDLVLDCAVASRTTVRASLARLQAAGLLEVHQTYLPGTTDTAHTLALPAELQEGPADATRIAVLRTGPSSFQPPQPGLPLRRALGLPACAVLRSLDTAGAIEEPARPADLARRAGLLHPNQHEPSAAQLRTLRRHLRTLAQHGLASLKTDGTWRATAAAMAGVADEQLQLVGQAAGAAVQTQIDAERAAFRARFDASNRRARWDRQRASVLALAAKTARATQKAWWNSLDADAQQQRRDARMDWFASLSPAEQLARKQLLARRRARTGEVEADRYVNWLRALSPDDLERRCRDRAADFAGRPAYEQQQLAAAWAEHRARWELPHHRRRAPIPSPPTPTLPEAGLLERQRPDLDELVLFDVASYSHSRLAGHHRRRAVPV